MIDPAPPRCLVIAEAGVNHNGRVDLALALVDAAAAAGADIVKFQTFTAAALVTHAAPKARYQAERLDDADAGQFAMLRALELDEQQHRTIKSHAEAKGIVFLSTPFDAASADLLVDRLALPLIKVGSGDLTNAPLLLQVAQADADVLLSTGMASLGEIEDALSVIAFGYHTASQAPAERPPASRRAFKHCWANPQMRAVVARRVRLLQCTTAYPAPPDSVNLRAMDTLARAFAVPVGFSDHSDGIAIALAAVARGACVIEKHITLDRTLPGPDHAASLEPAAFAEMVAGIRTIEAALGTGVKAPMPAERENSYAARKGLVASRAIRAGELFTHEMLTTKRPEEGLAPIYFWELLGTAAPRDLAADDPVRPW
jgi:N-acetylneuraminate synthase